MLHYGPHRCVLLPCILLWHARAQAPDALAVGRQLIDAVFPTAASPANRWSVDRRPNFELSSNEHPLRQVLQQSSDPAQLVTAVNGRPPPNADPATFIKYLIGNSLPASAPASRSAAAIVPYGSAVEDDLLTYATPTVASRAAPRRAASTTVRRTSVTTQSAPLQQQSVTSGGVIGFGDAVEEDLRIAKYARFKRPQSPASRQYPPIQDSSIDFNAAARPFVNLLVDKFSRSCSCNSPHNPTV